MADSVKRGFSDDVDYSRSSENRRMAKETIKTGYITTVIPAQAGMTAWVCHNLLADFFVRVSYIRMIILVSWRIMITAAVINLD
ncbi:30S ribosomal protein S19 [Neisseria macacae ATCC 33926]|uniref:Uncharacterized protein n=2 Tax=Neisseria TaxID=482 RepID=I2NVB5_NEISI|nr:30S ribosomal protein S19 [Neisseria macacae ATCC 33926]EIG29776.1 hypothetical protein HMPREF1051_2107 [Neisseria sicca VK64]